MTNSRKNVGKLSNHALLARLQRYQDELRQLARNEVNKRRHIKRARERARTEAVSRGLIKEEDYD